MVKEKESKFGTVMKKISETKEKLSNESIKGKELSPDKLKSYVEKQKQYSKDLSKLKSERNKQIANAILLKKTLSHNIVGSAHAKVPKYNAEKVVLSMGAEQGALVREVPKKVIVQDNRSLFFKNEEESELKSARSWLFKD